MFKKWKQKNRADRIFDVFNYLVLGLLGLMVLYPLYFIVIASVSDPVAINNGQVRLLPMGFNLDGYRKILEDGKIWTAYNNTVFYTVVGTSVNIILTMLIAYPLSRQNFFIRRGLMAFMMFTMYFQGGMIPTYLLMQKLNLYNTPWVMILLPAINVFNVIIATSNIRENIPNELYEAISGSFSEWSFRCPRPSLQCWCSIMAWLIGMNI